MGIAAEATMDLSRPIGDTGVLHGVGELMFPYLKENSNCCSGPASAISALQFQHCISIPIAAQGNGSLDP